MPMHMTNTTKNPKKMGSTPYTRATGCRIGATMITTDRASINIPAIIKITSVRNKNTREEEDTD